MAADEGTLLVVLVAEATDGETVWYNSVTASADGYDKYEAIRDMMNAEVRKALACTAPAGLPITVTELRQTIPLGPEDD